MKKIAILFNPAAGKGRAIKQKKMITSCLAKSNMYIDFMVTESEEHLVNLAAAAAKNTDQYGAIVGVGGDTTFNIIATEVLKQRDTSTVDAVNTVAVGMIGAGSANDIARGLGLEKIETACRAIINGNTKKMDAGCVKIGPDTLFFLGTLSLGLGVTVNRSVEDFRRRHKILSRWKPFDQLFPALYAIYDSFAQKKIPLKVEMSYRDLASQEQITLPVQFSLLVILNTPFYANGLQLGETNGLFDGVLNCRIIDTQSFVTTIGQGIRILRKKNKGENNEGLLRSNWYRISAPGGMAIQLDGEIIEEVKDIEVTLLPRYLDVFTS